MEFNLSEKEGKLYKEFQDQVKALYGEYGEFSITFTDVGGIGYEVTVFSKKANIVRNITDVDSW